MASKPILGYWDIRGYAEPIRLLLTYLGVDFEDKRYPLTVENEGSPWFNEKFTLGLDFPNLPYYIDGDVKLTHTATILRYLGRKYNLEGSTDAEKVAISLIEQQVFDDFEAFGRHGCDPKYDNQLIAEQFLVRLADSLKLLSDYLGERSFVAGTNISYVDFLLYEYLVMLLVIVPEVLCEYMNLLAFIDRIEKLNRNVLMYIKHSKHAPFFNPNEWNSSH